MARLVPATGSAPLKARFQGVALSSADDDELFTTGEVWDQAWWASEPDRLIYATAVERGWQLVTKDRRLRSHRHPRPVTIW